MFGGGANARVDGGAATRVASSVIVELVGGRDTRMTSCRATWVVGSKFGWKTTYLNEIW